MTDESNARQYHPKLHIELPPTLYGIGAEDFGNWVRRLEVGVAASANIDDYDLATILPARLGGAAFIFWDSLPPDKKKDFRSVTNEMRVVFGEAPFNIDISEPRRC